MRKFWYLPLLMIVWLTAAAPSQAAGEWECEEFTGPNCGEAINDVFMVASNEAWAVGDYGLILHKINGEWVREDSPTTSNLNRIQMITTQEKVVGWAVGEDGAILHFDGVSWSLAPFLGDVPDVDLYDIDLLDAYNGWAVGYDVWAGESAMMVLRDGVWEDYAASLYYNDIEMLSATDGWAVGNGGRILHYDGTDWQRVPSPVEVDLFALDTISPTEGWAVGETGHILHYLNGTWGLQDASDTVNYYGIDMISSNEGWAVGSVGHYIHYLNGTWTRTLGELAFSRAVDMVNASDGWAVSEKGGLNGWIYHYDGASWSLDSTPADSLFALQMLSASNGWAMGGTGSPYIQHYDGSAWAEVEFSGGGGAVYGMDMISAFDGWAVGEGGLLLHYQAGNWIQVASPTIAALRGVDMVSATEGWAVGDGVMLHFTGGNWEVYANTTPLVNEELFALDAIDADNAWAMGDAGVILHWDGVSWEIAPSPIYDPGSSWTEIRDVAMVAADDGWATGTAVLDSVITPVLLRFAGDQWELWATGGGGDFIEMLSPTEGWFGLEWYGDACYILHFLDQNGVVEETDFTPVYAPQCVGHVSFLSSDEGMAVVGSALIAGEFFDYLLHYHDGKWYDEQIARRFNLQDVDAVSAAEAWAVGFHTTRLSYYHAETSTILHYSNGDWMDYSKDPPLFDLDMLSTSEGWAVGGDERQGAIYHFDGLEWNRVLTPTYRLNAVHMLNADEGWAVGYNGSILHYNGTQKAIDAAWNEVPSPTPFELHDVFTVAADDVWAVGDWATILHFDGTAWTAYASPTTGDIHTIEMLSPTEGWAFGNGAAIHYLNGVWSDASAPSALHDLDMLAPDSGWAAGWNTIAYYDGEDWTEIEVQYSKYWMGIDMVSTSEGWIVGEDGFILRYNGSNWQIAGGPTAGTLQAVEMLSADEGWAIGNGTILHYTGGGWQVVIANRPTEKALYGIDMAAGGAEGWAVGQDGVMLRYRNRAWEKAANATTNYLYAVHMLSPSQGWAVGQAGTILQFNGSNWQYTGGQVTANLNDLYLNSSTDGWAVGDNATLLQFDGVNWNSVDLSTSIVGDMHSIDMASSSSGWIGTGAAFLNYKEGSWDWPFYGPPYINAYAIQTFSNASAWAVGESGSGQPIVTFSGDEWENYPSPTSQTLYGLTFPTSSQAWAVGENVILRYDNPGTDHRLYLPLILTK